MLATVATKYNKCMKRVNLAYCIYYQTRICCSSLKWYQYIYDKLTSIKWSWNIRKEKEIASWKYVETCYKINANSCIQRRANLNWLLSNRKSLRCYLQGVKSDENPCIKPDICSWRYFESYKINRCAILCQTMPKTYYISTKNDLIRT